MRRRGPEGLWRTEGSRIKTFTREAHQASKPGFQAYVKDDAGPIEDVFSICVYLFPALSSPDSRMKESMEFHPQVWHPGMLIILN